MKKLLTLCGYDSTWSFMSVTDDKIPGIEEYIEQNHRKNADDFEEYKNVKPFKFLPGHKALIFGIRSEIDNLQKNKRIKMKPKTVLSEDELQMSLLQQMSKFTSGKGLKIDWTSSIISCTVTSTENDAVAVCQITCPICDSNFKVHYEGHWKNSNLCKHMRKHMTVKEPVKNVPQTKNLTQPNKSSISYEAPNGTISFEEVGITIGLANGNENGNDEYDHLIIEEEE